MNIQSNVHSRVLAVPNNWPNPPVQGVVPPLPPFIKITMAMVPLLHWHWHTPHVLLLIRLPPHRGFPLPTLQPPREDALPPISPFPMVLIPPPPVPLALGAHCLLGQISKGKGKNMPG